MNETSHVKHRYQGAPGELVTINVTAHNTSHLVTFTLDGVSQALPAGTPIQFNLKNNSGEVTRLQLIMDFNAEGNYEIELENIVDCSADAAKLGTCVHTREGPPLVIENFTFRVA